MSLRCRVVFHVVTVHWQSDAWIETQLRFVRRYLPAGTRTYGVCNGIEPRWSQRFDWAADLEGTHAEKLNEVAAVVSNEAEPGDHLVFLDGDAFPIAPIDDTYLAGVPLAAVCRAENLGDKQPHPCFAVTTVGFWNEIHGDWRPGHTWVNQEGETVTDVGGNLLGLLDAQGTRWRPLLRTNKVDLHPLWFAVYGDVAYHHGAGFRERISRADGYAHTNPRRAAARARVPETVPVLGRVERAVRYRVARRRREHYLQEHEATDRMLSDEVVDRMEHDDDFPRGFLI